MNKNDSLDERLMKAQVAINNALNNAQLKEHLQKYGYNDERLQQGLALYNEARKRQDRQKKEYGDQFEMSGKLEKLVVPARETYSRLRKVARVAFREDASILNTLGLLSKTKSSLSGWLGQARQFYTIAIEKKYILAELEKFGITAADIQAADQTITEIERLNILQEAEKSEAQDATLERDNAIDEMEKWLWDLTDIARVALEKRPQLIEMLSVVEPS